MTTKQIKISIIIFVILIIVAGGYFAYKKYFLSQYQQTPENNYPAPAGNSTPREASSAPSSPVKTQNILIPGYKLYKNSDFGFEIQYPADWTATEENNENVRGEMVKEFFFKKPNSDLRFAILPRDGLSYGVGANGTSTPVYIGGFSGIQTKYILKDGRRLWLLFPQYGLFNWLQDLGRIDAMTSVENVDSDTQIFENMLSSFKLSK